MNSAATTEAGFIAFAVEAVLAGMSKSEPGPWKDLYKITCS